MIGVLVLSTAGSSETPNIPKRPDFEKIFQSSLNSAFGQWLREQTSNLDCNSTLDGSSYPDPRETVSNTTGAFFNDSVCKCWSNDTTPPVPKPVLSDFHPRNYDIIIGPVHRRLLRHRHHGHHRLDCDLSCQTEYEVRQGEWVAIIQKDNQTFIKFSFSLIAISVSLIYTLLFILHSILDMCSIPRWLRIGEGDLAMTPLARK